MFCQRTRAVEAVRVSVPHGSRCFRELPVSSEQSLFGEALSESERRRGRRGSAGMSLRGGRLPALPPAASLASVFRSCRAFGLVRTLNAVKLSTRRQPCPVGALHYQPTLSCRCGSRVLELLACEGCGEVFLGGYRSLDTQNPGEWFLSADHPDLEASPETAFLNRDFQSYAVFWPAVNVCAQSPCSGTKTASRRSWDAAALNTREGKLYWVGAKV